MGGDKIRYFRFVSGRWRWRPEKGMRALGFHLINMGQGGPELDAKGRPIPSPGDQARAIALNAEWDAVRRGLTPPPVEVYPRGSVGDGYQRAMAMRDAERKARGIVWTKEQQKRDDWPRAWRWLEPFGDCDPKTMEPEILLELRTKVGGQVSQSEGHRVIKVWRALWKKMAAMGYCDRGNDPSLMFANTAPDPRQHVWERREVHRLVQRAWRTGDPGLAALMAVVWDTMLSPGDARRLTAGQMARDDRGVVFFLDRAKTGRAAAGTLTRWSEAVLSAYLKTLGHELHPDAPLFRTPGSRPGAKGGRRWLPKAYTKALAEKHFRRVRTELFGPGEQRQLADMRRSGAVEGTAGGASPTETSNKMANTISASSRLQKTYTPVNVASVRRFDEAREVGQKRLREQKPTKSVMGPGGKVS
jgi:hypothetical protein